MSSTPRPDAAPAMLSVEGLDAIANDWRWHVDHDPTDSIPAWLLLAMPHLIASHRAQAATIARLEAERDALRLRLYEIRRYARKPDADPAAIYAWAGRALYPPKIPAAQAAPGSGEGEMAK